MIRLFIAIPIELPEPACDAYEELAALGSFVKLTSLENLHLTLRFIGEVPRTTIEPIAEVLDELQEEYGFEARTIKLTSVARFPSTKRHPPRVVFVKIDEDSERFVTEVSEKINAALEEMSPSIPRLDRNVVPHVTLCRVKDQEKAALKIEKIIEKTNQRIESEPEQALGAVRADRIELIASTLTGDGAFYNTQHEVELTHFPKPPQT
ncbi:RNA 2',3'-cyclic phosphodiesterase [Poriferisphaera sp. WC338]|uniref:RNA 2',3'-cyclic phosphodiesterase n=1 Tax=Poriferisphaera sp. WC338 TaxID=3425129 RepID=UPI003D814E61